MILPKTPSFRLDGKRALVTGASRGIGMGVAAALASSGAHVVLAARNRTDLPCVLSAIVAAGGSAETLQLDVTDNAAVAAAMEAQQAFAIRSIMQV